MEHRLSRGLHLIMMVFFLVVVTGGTALAGTGFPDVSSDYWAAKQISKMSAMGIIKGYEDGTFKPDKTVTQVEAVVMATRCMGDTTYIVDVPFLVPGWAEQEVAKALELGLIKRDEAFFAQADATRAWVVRLLVRMTGKEAEALGVQALPGFADSYSIPEWARGYVKVAQKNNLVGGYADNTFRPDRAVTRAELAVFLDRAQSFLTDISADIVKGRFLETGLNRLTISLDNGEKQVYMVPYDVPAYDGNGPISLSDLQRYDQVFLVTDGDSVKYLEKLSAGSVSSVVKGTVRRVYPEHGALVVEEITGEYRTLYLSGQDSILDTVIAGDEVEVTLDALGYIAGIVVNAHSQGLVNEGVVYDLYTEGKLLTLKLDNGKLASYRLADAVNVKAKGYRFPTLEDVREGDRVRVGIENQAVVEIEVLETASSLDINGKVLTLSADEGIITLDAGGELRAFYLKKDADIIISGLDNATLSDVVTGDEVQAHVENGKITRLEVKGRSVEGSISGTVLGIDTNNDVITLRDSKSNLHAYEVSDNARIIIDGYNKRLSDIKKDMRVEVRLLDEKIVYIRVDNSLVGTIANVDDKGLLLVLEDESGKRETYVIDDNVDVDSKDGRDELNEVKRGDYAEIVLDNNVVTEIKLRTVLVLRVESVREEYDRIYARDKDDDRERLYVRDGVELFIPGISYPNIEDIKEDDIIRAIYLGDDLKKVEVLKPKRARVMSVNSFTKVVTLKYDNDETGSITFNDKCEVIVGGRSYDEVDRLNVNDVVKVIENIKGGYTFELE